MEQDVTATRIWPSRNQSRSVIMLHLLLQFIYISAGSCFY